MERERHAAIVLAAGKGSRMKSDIPKQFMLLDGKPVLYYSLKVFEDSFADDIILVTGEGQEEYCRREIVDKYGFQKVRAVIAGGKERSDSVYRGLCALENLGYAYIHLDGDREDACAAGDLPEETGRDYVYIHDGARPFLDSAILDRARECVQKHQACAAGMPSKDTIKIADQNQFVVQTPPRKDVWMIQTPQVFSYPLIRKAYEMLQSETDLTVTDDAMVAETMLHCPVKLFEGSYRNIKITTPEDIPLANAYREGD